MNSKITDALAAIQRHTTTISGVVGDYRQAVDSIKADRIHNDAWKKEQIQAEAAFAANALNGAARAIFGQVVNSNGRHSLDANAPAWQGLDAASAALDQARAHARQTGTVSPASFELARSRAQTIIRHAQNADAFWQGYDQADPDTQAVLREFGPDMLSKDLEWMPVRGQLKAQHDARQNTPDVQQAQADLDQLQHALDGAYRALEVVLGSDPGRGAVQARETLYAIDRKTRTFTDDRGELIAALSFSRREYGAGDGGDYEGLAQHAAELMGGQR